MEHSSLKSAIRQQYCRYGHCARVATCYSQHMIGGYRCDEHGPQRDIQLPVGWDWARVEAEREKWGIGTDMVPVASADGAVAWGTLNSIRLERECRR
jgi:hypothetical protein